MYVLNLLGRVRLGLIPGEKIIDVFENQLAVFENQLTECRVLYLDIMKYYFLGKKQFITTVLGDEQALMFSARGEFAKVRSLSPVANF